MNYLWLKKLVFLHFIHLNNAEKYVNLEYDKRPNNIDVNLLKAEIAYTKNEVDLAKKLIQTASITNSKNPNLLELKAKI